METHLGEFFEKVPVDYPKDAPAGSMLVFNENAKLGSKARKQYGHSEIKGSNGNYYSYYQSMNPGGSARADESLPPQKYREMTGFTGYAYVYNGKKIS